MTDRTKLTALEIGAEIEIGAVDPRDVTEAFLSRIEETNGENKVYVTVTPDRARTEAAEASDRARSGIRRSPLDGVPISWKDLYDSAGVQTAGGSELLRGRIPDHDCPLLARSTRAGTICLGKTTLSELAFSGLGLNPNFGTPPNAVMTDVPRAPGGSSSGAAVSVAKGMAAIGIGSDTGGSVRGPAGWNGLVGLKTTEGHLPLEGAVILSRTLDTAGPLTHDVADAAAMWSIMARAPMPDLTGAQLSQMKFCVPTGLVWSELEDGIEDAVRGSIETLARAGASMTEMDVPELDEIFTLGAEHGGLVTMEGHAEWHERMEAEPDKVYPPILTRFRLGGKASMADYCQLLMDLKKVRASYAARTNGFDAVLMPTSPIAPPVITELEADDEYYRTRNLLSLRNTRTANMLGLCSITLPLGLTPTGSPAALMMHAAGGEDARLLRMAAAAEPLLKN